MENVTFIDGIKVKPCVGCGCCCIKARCSTSLRIWPYVKENECPGLIWDNEQNRYICKLAAMTGPKGIEYRAELYIGDGCCMSMNSWRTDIQPRRKCDTTEPEIVKYTLDKIFAAFLRSLAGNFISGDVISLTCFGMAHTLEQQGMSKEEIQAIMKEIVYHFSNSRSHFQENFMG